MDKSDVDWFPPFMSYDQPVWDTARSTSAVQKPARPTPGAGAESTPPQPVETQPQTPASLTVLADAAGRHAEKAVGAWEDAKITLARSKQQAASEAQITQANLQVALHKLSAIDAVRTNIQAQTKLEGAAERKHGEAEAALDKARSKSFKNPASVRAAELASRELEYNSALRELSRCRQDVAEALTLLDIAEGNRFGRGEHAEDELAQEVTLADAQRTERDLNASRKELAGADRFNRSEKQRCEDDFHTAASANLAAWLALRDNVKDGTADQRKEAEAGLKRAKRALAFDP